MLEKLADAIIFTGQKKEWYSVGEEKLREYGSVEVK